MEVVISSGFAASGSTPVRLVIEGLLAHFFSPNHPRYAPEDVLWFLKFANEQEQWCCHPLQGKQDSEVQPSAETPVSLFA